MRSTAVNLSERAIAYALRQTANHIQAQGLGRDHSREDVQTMVELGRAWLDFQDLKDWITAPLDDEDIFEEWLNKEPDSHDSEPETPYQPGETVQGATPVHEVVEESKETKTKTRSQIDFEKSGFTLDHFEAALNRHGVRGLADYLDAPLATATQLVTYCRRKEYLSPRVLSWVNHLEELKTLPKAQDPYLPTIRNVSKPLEYLRIPTEKAVRAAANVTHSYQRAMEVSGLAEHEVRQIAQWLMKCLGIKTREQLKLVPNADRQRCVKDESTDGYLVIPK